MTDPILKAGQVWRTKKGRRLDRTIKAVGAFRITDMVYWHHVVSGRTGCSFQDDFHAWIRRTQAELVEGDE